MKLNQNEIEYILNVVKTAKLVNINNVIIEPNIVRAMDDARNVVIFQTEQVPSLPFESIGLTRIDVLLARYEVAKTSENFTIEAMTSSDNKFATSLILKGKGLKVEYRCGGDPSKINVPRVINDSFIFDVQLTGDAVALLQKGQTAMGAEDVTIVNDEEGVSFEIVDVNNDVFKHTFAEPANSTEDSEFQRFAHRYPIKILLAIFKTDPTGIFRVGKKGMLEFCVNGLNVYVLPHV